MAIYEHDVLVVGAGLAGLRAALEAHRNGADVAILSKVHPVRSHSNAAQGGINAAMGEEGSDDSWEIHAFDTVKGSDYLGDQDAIEVMCKEAGKAIIELEHMGVIFNRDDRGYLGRRAFGGATYQRTFYVADITGQAILHVLYEQTLKAGVRVYEEWFVSSLIVENGECAGVVALELMTGQLHVIKAKAVILCTGGAGRVYEPSTNALICTGDGIALAYYAGAPITDMEMVQYHPTTLKSNGALMSEGARGEGAYLRNKNGERFMQRYAPSKMELAARDVVSRSEQTEINEGRGVDGCVLLDCTHLGRQLILTKLYQIYELALDFADADMTKEPVPVRPGVHYIMGGIKTDVDGRTSLPGLYAAGECACVSVHGGNRLGANSLLDTVVFGRRSGEDAAKRARQVKHQGITESIASRDTQRIKGLMARERNANETVAKIRLEMGQAMNEFVGVYRDESGLKQALDKLQELKGRYDRVPVGDKGKTFNTNLMFALELSYMLDLAEAIVCGALERKESRGAHSRTDYPKRNDQEWLKHILLHYNPTGAPKISYLPVTVTRWTPQERVY
jgi:succinate dehydrogenase / fumarate reductase flavoprotein subunit